MRKMVLFLLCLAGSLSADTACPPKMPYYYSMKSNDFFTYGELLYWQPVSPAPLNWDQVTSLYQEFGSTTIIHQQQDVKSLSYHFRPGYRVGAGCRFGKNAAQNIRPWQVFAEYTHLSSAKSSSFNSPGLLVTTPNVSVFQAPLVPALTSNSIFIVGKSHIVLQYNRVDFGFAWPMWLGSSVIFRLMTGASAAWIRNDWTSSYYETPTLSVELPFDTTALKWHWWGGGAFGKGDIYLPIGRGLGFFANGGFSLFFGRMTEKEQYIENSPALNEDNVNVYHYESFQPVLQFGAGVDYKKWVRKVLIHLAVGWETNWWFSLDQFGRINQRFSLTPSVGQFFANEPTDLLLQGLTGRFGLEF